VKGDPDCPLNQGVICPKGASQLEVLYHPDRLIYPQQREGRRGEGRWQRISWDEALSQIAKKLEGIHESGPEAVVLGLGSPKGLELGFANRLASVFGTPNVVTPGPICHMPRELASTYTCGSPTSPDYEHPPRCLVFWGSNTLDTNEGGMGRPRLRPAQKAGSKFIVIDPVGTSLASRADLWLRIRPGSDGALALGMIRLIIDQGLYDKESVSRWTVGFDALRESVQGYTLQRVAEMTWLPQQQIEEATRLYATTKPAAIQWGNALDCGINSFQTCRAVSILRAITGNLDQPGGDILPTPLPLMRPGELMLLRKFPRPLDKTLGREFKIAARSFFTPEQAMVRAILEEKPYPVRALLLFGSNPLLTYTNSHEVYRALHKIELLVVSELFMTPTAELADLVLPAATNLEFNEIGFYGPRTGQVVARQKVIEPVGECWPDMKIINELARKLGLGEHFWADPEECLDLILKPAGVSYEELKGKGMLRATKRYRKHEEDGFDTPSGKVELYSERLKELGYSPLPTFSEPPETPYSSPELAAEYPLILTSGKTPFFTHSAYRNVSTLRRMSGEPVTQLHPDAARGLGIEEGDRVYVETRRGRIQQKAGFNAMLDPRVVAVSYGWWFPERDVADLHGWAESNINVLTESAPPYEPALGSTALRPMLCKVYKA